MTFGERLRQGRLAAGIHLKDLAAVLKLSVVHVSEIERGIRGPMRPGLITRAADELGMDEEELQRLADRAVVARWRAKFDD